MSERSDNEKYQYRQTNIKMSDTDLGTKKTLIVLVIVVGCFAVLWPKVLYPMLLGPTNQRMKPNNLDKGCCEVISDIDVNTVKIMNELCNTIIQDSKEKPVKGQGIIDQCRKEVFNKCGIDISAILQEQIRLGNSFKQIVDEVRSHNGSLCLKYQFGISPWRLGAPHKVTINLSPIYVRQERPSHLRPEMLHPALRERGSAIVQPYQQPPKPGQARFVEGRPGPVPGVRPPMGGAGHMVHSPKSSNSMGVIMPIYTVGIVIFFSYTLMKLLFKKKPDGPGAPLYPPVEPSETFRKEVFESQKRKSSQGGPLIVNAMTALLDEVDQELEARRKAREVTSQKEDVLDDQVLANGSAKHLPQEHEQPSVKILGMEMTASCEGGKKWDRPESPVIPKPNQTQIEPIEPPQEIFLEGTLPAQSQLLVADSTIEEEANSISSSTDPPVILASKMTLSVISLDVQENGKETNQVEKLDDVIEESKYTTASEATAADCEISDEEGNDIEEDVEKVPECDMYVEKEAEKLENDMFDEKIPESNLKINDNFEQSKNNLKISETDIINKEHVEMITKLEEPKNITKLEEILEHKINNKDVLVVKTLEESDINKLEHNGLEKSVVEQDNEIKEQAKGSEIEQDKENKYRNISENENPENKQKSEPEDLNLEVEEEEHEDNEFELNVLEDNLENEENIEDVSRSDDNSDECDIDKDEDIENIDRSEDNSLDNMEIEEIIIFEEDIEDDNFDDDIEHHEPVHFLSPDAVENIGNFIDEIITDGALRLENANENDFTLENLRHSTDDFIDNCDNENEDAEENYNNNNEPTLDQNENTFEQTFAEIENPSDNVNQIDHEDDLQVDVTKADEKL